MTKTTISNTRVFGNIKSSSKPGSIGGLIAYADYTATISNSSFVGTLPKASYAIGYDYRGASTVSNSYAIDLSGYATKAWNTNNTTNVGFGTSLTEKANIYTGTTLVNSAVVNTPEFARLMSNYYYDKDAYDGFPVYVGEDGPQNRKIVWRTTDDGVKFDTSLVAYTNASDVIAFKADGSAITAEDLPENAYLPGSTGKYDNTHIYTTESGWSNDLTQVYSDDETVYTLSLTKGYVLVEGVDYSYEGCTVLIHTNHALEDIGRIPTGACMTVTYKLTNDLDYGVAPEDCSIDNVNWLNENSVFTGILDGDGHTVKNVCLVNADSANTFLLRTNGESSVKNLDFNNIYLKSTYGTGDVWTSIFNYYNKTTLSYETSTVSFSNMKLENVDIISNTPGAYTALLLAQNNDQNTLIENVDAKNIEINATNPLGYSLSSNRYVGGLLAFGRYSTITNAKFKGNINSEKGYVGGIAGQIGIYDSNPDTIRVVNNSFEGNINSTSVTHLGGLVANISNTSTKIVFSEDTVRAHIVDNSSNSYDNLYVGGVVGYSNSYVAFDNIHFIGNIRHNPSQTYSRYVYAGGIIGEALHVAKFNDVHVQSANGVAAENIISTEEGSAAGYVGGICGYIAGNGSNEFFIKNSSVVGSIDAKIKSYSYIGGFVGYVASSGDIESSTFEGKILTNLTSYYVGGIFGQLQDYSQSKQLRFKNVSVKGVSDGDKKTLLKLTNTHSSTGSSYVYAGGLAGYTYRLNYMENVSVEGSVIYDDKPMTATIYIGGFFGYAYDYQAPSMEFKESSYKGTISVDNSTGTGSGNSDSFIGGFAGYMYTATNVVFDGITVESESGLTSDSIISFNRSLGIIYAGGLFGYYYNDYYYRTLTVKNIDVKGIVGVESSASPRYYIGGLFGKIYRNTGDYTKYENIDFTGLVTLNSTASLSSTPYTYIGALAGMDSIARTMDLSIKNVNIASPTKSSTDDVIRFKHTSTMAPMQLYAGGVFGHFNGASAFDGENVFVKGKFNLENANTNSSITLYAGTFIGLVNNSAPGELRNSYYIGSVDTTGSIVGPPITAYYGANTINLKNTYVANTGSKYDAARYFSNSILHTFGDINNVHDRDSIVVYNYTTHGLDSAIFLTSSPEFAHALNTFAFEPNSNESHPYIPGEGERTTKEILYTSINHDVIDTLFRAYTDIHGKIAYLPDGSAISEADLPVIANAIEAGYNQIDYSTTPATILTYPNGWDNVNLTDVYDNDVNYVRMVTGFDDNLIEGVDYAIDGCTVILKTERSVVRMTTINTPSNCPNLVYKLERDMDYQSSYDETNGCLGNWNNALVNTHGGTFDGDGHTIRNICFVNPTGPAVVIQPANHTSRNVNFENIYVEGLGTVSIMGPSVNLFENIELNNVTIVGHHDDSESASPYEYAGMLTNIGGGKIINVRATNSTVKGNILLGAFTGDGGYTITDSYFIGNIIPDGIESQGLAGGNGNVYSNSYIIDLTGNIHYAGKYRDGIIGVGHSPAEDANVYVKGSLALTIKPASPAFANMLQKFVYDPERNDGLPTFPVEGEFTTKEITWQFINGDDTTAIRAYTDKFGKIAYKADGTPITLADLPSDTITRPTGFIKQDTIESTVNVYGYPNGWLVDLDKVYNRNATYVQITSVIEPEEDDEDIEVFELVEGEDFTKDGCRIVLLTETGVMKLGQIPVKDCESPVYVLAHDMDFGNTGKTCEETNWDNTYANFFGTLDGDGYTIKNVCINKVNSRYATMFGIEASAAVQNINFQNIRLKNENEANLQITAEVSLFRSKVEQEGETLLFRDININDMALNVVFGRAQVGTLMGSADNEDYEKPLKLSIENVNVENSKIYVLSGTSVGGLVGMSNEIDITSSSFEGNIQIDADHSEQYTDVGGFIGYTEEGSATIQNSDVIAAIVVKQSYASYAGGFIGDAYNADISIENSDANAVIRIDNTYETYTGGLIGYSYTDEGTLSLLNSVFKGSITADVEDLKKIGGLVGWAEYSAYDIFACTVEGSIDAVSHSDYQEAQNDVGGAFGDIEGGDFTAKNLNVTARISVRDSLGNNSVGGLIAMNDGNSFIKNSNFNGQIWYNDQVVDNTTPRVHIGGIIGYQDRDITLNNVNALAEDRNTNLIYASIQNGSADVGGIIGLNGWINSFILQNGSSVVGQIEVSASEAYIGGAVGKGYVLRINSIKYFSYIGSFVTTSTSRHVSAFANSGSSYYDDPMVSNSYAIDLENNSTGESYDYYSNSAYVTTLSGESDVYTTGSVVGSALVKSTDFAKLLGSRWKQSDDENEGFPYYQNVPEGSCTVEIATAADLRNIGNYADACEDVSYLLTADIDFGVSAEQCSAEKKNWNHVISDSVNTSFSGVLNGDGHKISGICYPVEDEAAAYIFDVSEGATIKNVVFEDIYIEDTREASTNPFAVSVFNTRGFEANSVLYSNIALNNIILKGEGSSDYSTLVYTGILSAENGYNNILIDSVKVTNANVNAKGIGVTGGLVGISNNQIVIDSAYFEGSVSNMAMESIGYVGGLVGGGTALINNAHYIGDVKVANTEYMSGGIFVGGLVGYYYTSNSDLLVKNSSFKGIVELASTGQQIVAGAIAANVDASGNATTFDNVIAESAEGNHGVLIKYDIDGSGTIGGLVGLVSGDFNAINGTSVHGEISIPTIPSSSTSASGIIGSMGTSDKIVLNYVQYVGKLPTAVGKLKVNAYAPIEDMFGSYNSLYVSNTYAVDLNEASEILTKQPDDSLQSAIVRASDNGADVRVFNGTESIEVTPRTLAFANALGENYSCEADDDGNCDVGVNDGYPVYTAPAAVEPVLELVFGVDYEYDGCTIKLLTEKSLIKIALIPVPETCNEPEYMLTRDMEFGAEIEETCENNWNNETTTFGGTLNGNGYDISGICITEGENDGSYRLFNLTSQYSKVHNISISNIKMQGSGSATIMSLFCNTQGNIEFDSVFVDNINLNAGGMNAAAAVLNAVGATGSAKNIVVSNADITVSASEGYAGGLLALNTFDESYVQIENIDIDANITGQANTLYVGEVLAKVSTETRAYNVHVTGSISTNGSEIYAGGLYGKASPYCDITDVSFTGTITSNSVTPYIGGLIGYANSVYYNGYSANGENALPEDDFINVTLYSSSNKSYVGGAFGYIYWNMREIANNGDSLQSNKIRGKINVNSEGTTNTYVSGISSYLPSAYINATTFVGYLTGNVGSKYGFGPNENSTNIKVNGSYAVDYAGNAVASTPSSYWSGASVVSFDIENTTDPVLVKVANVDNVIRTVPFEGISFASAFNSDLAQSSSNYEFCYIPGENNDLPILAKEAGEHYGCEPIHKLTWSNTSTHVDNIFFTDSLGHVSYRADGSLADISEIPEGTHYDYLTMKIETWNDANSSVWTGNVDTVFKSNVTYTPADDMLFIAFAKDDDIQTALVQSNHKLTNETDRQALPYTKPIALNDDKSLATVEFWRADRNYIWNLDTLAGNEQGVDVALYVRDTVNFALEEFICPTENGSLKFSEYDATAEAWSNIFWNGNDFSLADSAMPTVVYYAEDEGSFFISNEWMIKPSDADLFTHPVIVSDVDHLYKAAIRNDYKTFVLDSADANSNYTTEAELEQITDASHKFDLQLGFSKDFFTSVDIEATIDEIDVDFSKNLKAADMILDFNHYVLSSMPKLSKIKFNDVVLTDNAIYNDLEKPIDSLTVQYGYYNENNEYLIIIDTVKIGEEITLPKNIDDMLISPMITYKLNIVVDSTGIEPIFKVHPFPDTTYLLDQAMIKLPQLASLDKRFCGWEFTDDNDDEVGGEIIYNPEEEMWYWMQDGEAPFRGNLTATAVFKEYCPGDYNGPEYGLVELRPQDPVNMTWKIEYEGYDLTSRLREDDDGYHKIEIPEMRGLKLKASAITDPRFKVYEMDQVFLPWRNEAYSEEMSDGMFKAEFAGDYSTFINAYAMQTRFFHIVSWYDDETGENFALARTEKSEPNSSLIKSIKFVNDEFVEGPLDELPAPFSVVADGDSLVAWYNYGYDVLWDGTQLTYSSDYGYARTAVLNPNLKFFIPSDDESNPPIKQEDWENVFWNGDDFTAYSTDIELPSIAFKNEDGMYVKVNKWNVSLLPHVTESCPAPSLESVETNLTAEVRSYYIDVYDVVFNCDYTTTTLNFVADMASATDFNATVNVLNISNLDVSGTIFGEDYNLTLALGNNNIPQSETFKFENSDTDSITIVFAHKGAEEAHIDTIRVAYGETFTPGDTMDAVWTVYEQRAYDVEIAIDSSAIETFGTIFKLGDDPEQYDFGQDTVWLPQIASVNACFEAWHVLDAETEDEIVTTTENFWIPGTTFGAVKIQAEFVACDEPNNLKVNLVENSVHGLDWNVVYETTALEVTEEQDAKFVTIPFMPSLAVTVEPVITDSSEVLKEYGVVSSDESNEKVIIPLTNNIVTVGTTKANITLEAVIETAFYYVTWLDENSIAYLAHTAANADGVHKIAKKLEKMTLAEGANTAGLILHDGNYYNSVALGNIPSKPVSVTNANENGIRYYVTDDKTVWFEDLTVEYDSNTVYNLAWADIPLETFKVVSGTNTYSSANDSWKNVFWNGENYKLFGSDTLLPTVVFKNPEGAYVTTGKWAFSVDATVASITTDHVEPAQNYYLVNEGSAANYQVDATDAMVIEGFNVSVELLNLDSIIVTGKVLGNAFVDTLKTGNLNIPVLDSAIFTLPETEFDSLAIIATVAIENGSETITFHIANGEKLAIPANTTSISVATLATYTITLGDVSDYSPLFRVDDIPEEYAYAQASVALPVVGAQGTCFAGWLVTESEEPVLVANVTADENGAYNWIPGDYFGDVVITPLFSEGSCETRTITLDAGDFADVVELSAIYDDVELNVEDNVVTIPYIEGLDVNYTVTLTDEKNYTIQNVTINDEVVETTGNVTPDNNIVIVANLKNLYYVTFVDGNDSVEVQVPTSGKISKADTIPVGNVVYTAASNEIDFYASVINGKDSLWTADYSTVYAQNVRFVRQSYDVETLMNVTQPTGSMWNGAGYNAYTVDALPSVVMETETGYVLGSKWIVTLGSASAEVIASSDIRTFIKNNFEKLATNTLEMTLDEESVTANNIAITVENVEDLHVSGTVFTTPFETEIAVGATNVPKMASITFSSEDETLDSIMVAIAGTVSKVAVGEPFAVPVATTAITVYRAETYSIATVIPTTSGKVFQVGENPVSYDYGAANVEFANVAATGACLDGWKITQGTTVIATTEGTVWNPGKTFGDVTATAILKADESCKSVIKIANDIDDVLELEVTYDGEALETVADSVVVPNLAGLELDYTITLTETKFHKLSSIKVKNIAVEAAGTITADANTIFNVSVNDIYYVTFVDGNDSVIVEVDANGSIATADNLPIGDVIYNASSNSISFYVANVSDTAMLWESAQNVTFDTNVRFVKQTYDVASLMNIVQPTGTMWNGANYNAYTIDTMPSAVYAENGKYVQGKAWNIEIATAKASVETSAEVREFVKKHFDKLASSSVTLTLNKSLAEPYNIALSVKNVEKLSVEGSVLGTSFTAMVNANEINIPYMSTITFQSTALDFVDVTIGSTEKSVEMNEPLRIPVGTTTLSISKESIYNIQVVIPEDYGRIFQVGEHPETYTYGQDEVVFANVGSTEATFIGWEISKDGIVIDTVTDLSWTPDTFGDIVAKAVFEKTITIDLLRFLQSLDTNTILVVKYNGEALDIDNGKVTVPYLEGLELEYGFIVKDTLNKALKAISIAGTTVESSGTISVDEDVIFDVDIKNIYRITFDEGKDSTVVKVDDDGKLDGGMKIPAENFTYNEEKDKVTFWTGLVDDTLSLWDNDSETIYNQSVTFTKQEFNADTIIDFELPEEYIWNGSATGVFINPELPTVVFEDNGSYKISSSWTIYLNDKTDSAKVSSRQEVLAFMKKYYDKIDNGFDFVLDEDKAEDNSFKVVVNDVENIAIAGTVLNQPVEYNLTNNANTVIPKLTAPKFVGDKDEVLVISQYNEKGDFIELLYLTCGETLILASNVDWISVKKLDHKDTYSIERAEVALSGTAMHLDIMPAEITTKNPISMIVRVYAGDSIIVDSLMTDTLAMRNYEFEHYPLAPGKYHSEILLKGAGDMYVFKADSFSISEIARTIAPGAWSIVSLSGVDDSFEIPAENEAAIYYWNESTALGEFMQYHRLANVDSIAATTGYWYYTKTPMDLSVSTRNVEDSIVWQLQNKFSGWNMVANPYSWKIALNTQDFRSPEDTSTVFWRWNAETSSYVPADTLDMYEGMWIYTDENRDFAVSAKPAFATNSVNAAPKTALRKQSKNSWSINLKLTGENGQEDSWNVIGVGSKAINVLEPPTGMGENVSLSLAENNKILAKSIKSPIEETSWNVSYKASTAQVGKLSVEGLEELSELGYSAMLTIDDESIILSPDSEIKLNIARSAKKAKLEIRKSSELIKVAAISNLHYHIGSSSMAVYFTLSGNTSGIKTNVRLVDIHGQVISNSRDDGVKGDNKVVLDIPKSSGIYYLNVSVGKTSKNIKIKF